MVNVIILGINLPASVGIGVGPTRWCEAHVNYCERLMSLWSPI
jgi:hypothetical protein